MFKKLFITSLLMIFICLNAALAEEYKEKKFDHLNASLKGISTNQIEQHLQLYRGYVKKINELNKKLKKTVKQNSNPVFSEYRAINSAIAFAHNGAVLHELYFSNLSSKSTKLSKELLSKINKDFGSYENYLGDLIASGKAARSGWAISAYNPINGKLQNFTVDEHDLHIPIGIKPILVMDLWEHAYMIDYGINKNSYIEAFIKNIDWDKVSERYSAAIGRN